MTDSTFPDIAEEAPRFVDMDFGRVYESVKIRQKPKSRMTLESDYFRMTNRTEFKEAYPKALRCIYAKIESVDGRELLYIGIKKATPTLYYLECEIAIP